MQYKNHNLRRYKVTHFRGNGVFLTRLSDRFTSKSFLLHEPLLILTNQGKKLNLFNLPALPSWHIFHLFHGAYVCQSLMEREWGCFTTVKESACRISLVCACLLLLFWIHEVPRVMNVDVWLRWSPLKGPSAQCLQHRDSSRPIRIRLAHG